MADVRRSEDVKMSIDQQNALTQKRVQEARYRQILDAQVDVEKVKNFNRNKMNRVEKTINYDDLQEWKVKGKDYYTRQVPGIQSTVNMGVAKRVLGMFGRDATNGPPSRYINQNLPPYSVKDASYGKY